MSGLIVMPSNLSVKKLLVRDVLMSSKASMSFLAWGDQTKTVRGSILVAQQLLGRSDSGIGQLCSVNEGERFV